VTSATEHRDAADVGDDVASNSEEILRRLYAEPIAGESEGDDLP
jgi:hypothetical protein